SGAITLRGKFQGALLHVLGKLLGLNDFVDETPVFGALAANAVLIRAKNVGMITANFSLVGEARQPAGSGQNAQQRQLRQTYGGGTIIDQNDFIAGKSQFVASARGGS